MTRVLQALDGVMPGLERAGTSDLAVGGRKFSGNSQQRKRTHLLHHGTLLYDFDLELISRYLHLPERQPEYRANREHGDFVMNLAVGVEELKRRLRAAWTANTELRGWPRERVAELVRDKHTRADWIRRR
jgi:lipoate-protein ligase A